MKAQNSKTLTHRDLQKALPSSIRGLSPDSEPSGNTIKMGDQLFSTVEQNFIKDDLFVKITLFDYSQAVNMFVQTALIYTQGISYESEEGYARSLTFSQAGVDGWEIFDIETQTAEIFIGVNNRFFIIITSEGYRDTDFTKSLADPIIQQLLKF